MWAAPHTRLQAAPGPSPAAPPPMASHGDSSRFRLGLGMGGPRWKPGLRFHVIAGSLPPCGSVQYEGQWFDQCHLWTPTVWACQQLPKEIASTCGRCIWLPWRGQSNCKRQDDDHNYFSGFRVGAADRGMYSVHIYNIYNKYIYIYILYMLCFRNPHCLAKIVCVYVKQLCVTSCWCNNWLNTWYLAIWCWTQIKLP